MTQLIESPKSGILASEVPPSPQQRIDDWHKRKVRYYHNKPTLGGVTPDQFVKQLAKAVEEDL